MKDLKECVRCGFNVEGLCTCPPYNKWYACPIENKKSENVKVLKEYADNERGTP